MKKLLLICFLISSLVYSQTLKLFWDLDGDKVADETYTCSNGDTITAKLFLTNGTDTSITAGKPIFSFELPVLYGYYTRWSSNSDYSNILSFYSLVYDSTALDTMGTVGFINNSTFKRFILTYQDAADSSGITADSCIASIQFIVSGTGNQKLHFYYLGEEDNYTMRYNTAILNKGGINYSIWARDCTITSE